MQNKIFLIIPAYNEAERIGAVLEKAKQYCKNIIVIDDGSCDQTFSAAAAGGVLVLQHKINLGKGASLATGCEAALILGAEILVFMDADLQHNPEDIPRLVAAIQNQGYDLVCGDRKMNKKMPLSMRLGNIIFSRAIRYFYNFKLSDTQCGFRALRAEKYPQIKWQAQGYGVETEMLINAWQKKLRCASLSIQTIYYDRYKGTTIIDGFKILAKIIEKRITF
ncbi:MAG: glycosyltransferase family 2 protein [bacterium]|nr:glycosyltransferase family 2 protein [bacterium]